MATKAIVKAVEVPVRITGELLIGIDGYLPYGICEILFMPDRVFPVWRFLASNKKLGALQMKIIVFLHSKQ